MHYQNFRADHDHINHDVDERASVEVMRINMQLKSEMMHIGLLKVNVKKKVISVVSAEVDSESYPSDHCNFTHQQH